MIDGRPRSASVIAIRQSTLSYVSRDAFVRWCSNHLEIYQELVTALAARLREADEAMAAASFLSGKGRVARALLELARHIGVEDAKGRITLNQKLNQSDIAAMAGAAREQVNRVLGDWRRRGLVSLASRYYCIEKPAALEREVDADEG
jgi:CRP/FNR family transcriptional regulator, cyclic AMP receptor protein